MQPSLSRIWIKVAPILETLDGADALASLSVLRIATARELCDLSALDSGLRSLVKIALEECRSVESLDDLAALRVLSFLGISDSGRIASLSPVANMSHLQTLHAWGSTLIEDGDLSPLLRLPELTEVRMRDRREYRPSLAAVQEHLGSREGRETF